MAASRKQQTKKMYNTKRTVIMKTGIELINEERNKQIEKHGFTGKHHAEHPEWYADGQLLMAARYLSYSDGCEYRNAILSGYYPDNWDKDWFKNLMERPHKERIIIAAALIASELDRINELKTN